MAHRHFVRHWVLFLMIAAVALGGLLAVEPVRAGQLEDLGTSLNLVPDDAAFCSTMLRNREQIEAIGGSQAWSKLKSMPFVQMGLALYYMQAANPESVPGQIQTALKDPEVRKLLDLAADMTSDEVFCYGDQSLVGAMELMQQIGGAMRYGPAIMQISGKAKGINENQLQGMLLLSALAENVELIKAPDMVMGFKVSNTELATEQLLKLEALATEALEQEPQLQGRLKRATVAGHEYLTLTLDGSMVPWDEVPLEMAKELESNEGDLDKVVARLKQSKLVVALGLRKDYLLLSIGSSTDALARLGESKRLVDRPEIQRLEKHADQRLISVAYVSQAMMARLASSDEDVDDLLEAVDEVLPAAELEPEIEAQLRKDVAALAEDVKGLIPEPGAISAVSFLTDQGIEGYQYNFGDHSQWDGTKPLGMLSHVGGNPFLAMVARAQDSPEDYDLVVKWLKVAYGYVEKLALKEMSERERQQFEKAVTLIGPLLERADKANRELLIPALADSQIGLVIDTKLTSKQFAEELPATEKPMPMLEPAVLIGVSDAKLLRRACREYHEIADALVKAIREIEPGAIPEEFVIPDAEVSESDAGTVFSYALPVEWGVDEQIVPNFGLSESVAVLTISHEHTQRLLEATPLAAGGVLADPDRPLAVAAVVNWAAFIDALTPWVDLALKAAADDAGDGFNPMAGVGAQVHTVLDVLKVLRTTTAESYIEDDAMVTHTLNEIHDLEE
ncbi:MAG: hypothetical protein JXB62_18535 [Pirellulales bacterium]|nr:hypothetical protein [Pirellulales bacterium]